MHGRRRLFKANIRVRTSLDQMSSIPGSQHGCADGRASLTHSSPTAAIPSFLLVFNLESCKNALIRAIDKPAAWPGLARPGSHAKVQAAHLLEQIIPIIILIPDFMAHGDTSNELLRSHKGVYVLQ